MKTTLCTVSTKTLPASLLSLAFPITGSLLSSLHAADVQAVTNNGDWMAAGTWSDNAVPSAGNDYFVPSGIAIDGYEVGSTANNNAGTVNRIFGGKSLTIQNGGALYLDSQHNTSYPDWYYSIPGLTLADGSSLHFRGGAGTDFFLPQGFAVAADATAAIRHSAGSYDQRVDLGPITGPASATIQVIASQFSTQGGAFNKDNYAKIANSEYAGNWFIDATAATAGKNVRLRADAPNALGTGTVTIGRQAILQNNAAGGLDSLTGIVLQETSSLANLGSGWTNPAGSLALHAGTLQLGSGGFGTASIASLNHGGGILQLDIGPNPGQSDRIVLSGDYTTDNGPIDLYLGADPGANVYDLITYGGALNGTPDILLVTPSRLIPAYSNGSGNNDKITVSFSGATADLVWKGGDPVNPNTWDTDITPNFDNGGTPDKFLTIDSVTFDDTAASFTPTVSGTVIPRAVTFNNSANAYTLGGTAIGGTASLVKNGSADLTITSANTHSGGTTLNAGRLRIGNNAAAGSGTLAINGGVLSGNDGDTAADPVVNGTARTISAPVSINSGFTLGNAVNNGAIHFSGPVTLAANAVVTVESGTGMDLSGVLGGTGNIEYKRSTHPQALWNWTNAGNTFTGDITITSGRLRFNPAGNSDTALGNASNKIVFNGEPVATFGNGQGTASLQQTVGQAATIAATREIVINAGKEGTLYTWGSQNFTVNAPVTGGGALRKEDGGTLILTAANTYTGGTKVTNGIVRATHNNAFGTGDVIAGAWRNPAQDPETAATLTSRIELSDVTVVNNFVLDSRAQTGFLGPLTAVGGALSVVNGNVTISANVGNGGHLASSGAGSVLRINGAINSLNGVTPNARVGIVEVGGGGNYATFNVGEGTLRLVATNGVNPAAQLNIASSAAATFDLNGHNQTLARLTRGGFAGAVTNTAETPSVLTIDNTVDHTFAGTTGNGIGSLSLVKSGPARLTLTGAASHTGPTQVQSGALYVNAPLSASHVTVSAGGAYGGTGTVTETITTSGTLAPGDGVGQLFTNSTVTFEPGSGYQWEIGDWNGSAAGTDWDLIDALELVLNATQANKLVVTVTGIPANFSETAKTFEIARSADPITGFNAAAIEVQTSGFPGTGAWTVQQSGSSIELVYAAGSGTPFSNWAIANGIPGADPSDDADNDGVRNGIEFVIGGDPDGADSSHLLPTVSTADPAYLTFAFRRTGASAFYNPSVEYGGDLEGWTAAVHDGTNVIVSTENNFEPGVDLVTVKLLRSSLGGSGKLFARLRVNID